MNIFEHLEQVSEASGWPMERILTTTNFFDQMDLSRRVASKGEDAIPSHLVVQAFRESDAYQQVTRPSAT